jgi:ABC-type antimicrobial peptide transport system permease subunit
VGRRIRSIQQVGPLGRNLSGIKEPFRIVGVIGDIHQAPIGGRAEPVIYHTQRQFPFRAMTIVARGDDPATLVSGIRSALRALNPSLPLGTVKTMDERLADATAAPRLLASVLMTFAVLTGLLAAVGVYGLLAWMVNVRRRELAIRLALGAQPGALARSVTAHGLLLAVAGITLGLGMAQLGRGLLQQVLFETATTDPVSLAGAAGVLLAAASVACLAPSLRATRVEPAQGLRGE